MSVRFVKDGFKTQATVFNNLKELDPVIKSKIIEQLKNNSEKLIDCPGSIDPNSIKLLSCTMASLTFEKKLINDKTFLEAYFSADLYIGTNPDPVDYVFKFIRELNIKTRSVETKVAPRGFILQYLIKK